MTTKRGLIPTLTLLAALGGAVTLLPTQAAAQGMPGAPAHAMQHREQRTGHVEGHIAFLKAELKITPAQEALFAGVAAAIRADVQDMEQTSQEETAKAPSHRTAVQALELRSNLTALRARSEERFLTAFRPLYDSLSAEQKQTADELLTRRGME